MTRLCLLLTGLLFLSPMAVAQEKDDPREGGLTGTGIVALISAPGQVEINGLNVVLPEAAPILSPLGEMSVKDLKPGDMVALQMTGDPDDMSFIEARRVIQMIGPISAVTDDTYTVLGTSVTRLASFTAAVGDWVAVSGHWREESLAASRIELVPPRGLVHLRGTYRPLTTDTGKVGGSFVRGALLGNLERGDVIDLIGRYDNGEVIVDAIRTGQFSSPVRVVLSQGFLSIPDAGGYYTVLGTGISSITDQPSMITEDQFVTVCGVDGRLQTDAQGIEDEIIQNNLIALGCAER